VFALRPDVRVVWLADIPVGEIDNPSFTAGWTADWVQTVQSTFTDGVNIDMEEVSKQTDWTSRGSEREGKSAGADSCF
jgi:hypothetical protein